MSVSQNNSNLDDELLSAYIDGELTEEERAAVEARLESDPAARELVAEMRSLSGTLKSLPRELLAEDLRSAVLSQIVDKQVSLPRAELTMVRRLMWPAIAIAATLLLVFVQEDQNREGDDVAKVEVRGGGEVRDRVTADQPEAATAALEDTAAPAVTAAVEDELSVVEAEPREAEAPAGAVRSELAGESAVAARRVVEEMAAADAELEGVVHLTLTDFRSGAERFNRLLISNGVQLVDGQASAPASVTADSARDAVDTDAAPNASTMSTRSAAPAAGFGGAATSDASADASTSESEPEPEMVLVEAPPEQIKNILITCNQDTETIEEVAVDPTASGMNNAPKEQRLSGYQQYSRSAGKLALDSDYKMTPEQQGVIAALNSLPKQVEPAEPNVENQQQQGWAARFRAAKQPVQLQELNTQYNQYRNQYFYGQAQQQSGNGGVLEAERKLAKDKAPAEQPLRVLFLLHPSADAAKK
jgi:hypothetical protein